MMMPFSRNEQGMSTGFYRGHFTQFGRCWPVAAEIEVSEGRVHGFSWDGPGPAPLSGWVIAGRLIVLSKRYDGHTVRMFGRSGQRGIISGRWRIGAFQRGLFEFWRDDRAVEDLRTVRERASMPFVPEPRSQLRCAFREERGLALGLGLGLGLA